MHSRMVIMPKKHPKCSVYRGVIFMWSYVPQLPMGGSHFRWVEHLFWMVMLYLKRALFGTEEMGVLLGKFGWSCCKNKGGVVSLKIEDHQKGHNCRVVKLRLSCS